MKSPTDFEILQFIRDQYYNAFISFEQDVPRRLTKIYVPIDINLIAKRFGVDGDIVFGRLYYHLNKKYGFKKDDGSKVEFFANSLAGEGKTEKHLINFPLLDAVLQELAGEKQTGEKQPRDFYDRILLFLYEKRDTDLFCNLFDLTIDGKERQIIRSKAKELKKEKLIEYGPSDLNMGFYPKQINKFELHAAEKKAMEARQLKYQNILPAKITLKGKEYVKEKILTLESIRTQESEPFLSNSNSQSLIKPSESIKPKKNNISSLYRGLSKTSKIIAFIIGVIASLATIYEVWKSL